MSNFAQELKDYLQDCKDNWTTTEYKDYSSGCSTCGWPDEEYEVIDGDALWAEIDKFCAEFEAKNNEDK